MFDKQHSLLSKCMHRFINVSVYIESPYFIMTRSPIGNKTTNYTYIIFNPSVNLS